MDTELLYASIAKIRTDIETAIRSGQFLRKVYDNGQKAKEALIRSQRLIMRIHEVAKVSLARELDNGHLAHTMHPPIGRSSPELSVAGFLKAKQQDIVATMHSHPPASERIVEGPLAGEVDEIGRDCSEHSIIIGVRSQLSSVAKNFDTLMERAFAETLNLRLRLPKLVMGEVYLLPVVEYDDKAMVQNEVRFRPCSVPIEKFIKTFLGITGRQRDLGESFYKYDRSCLILVDLRSNPPRVFESMDQLKACRVVSRAFQADFQHLSPRGFCRDLVRVYRQRHST